MKRILDVVFSLLGLLFTSPLLITVMFLIWRQDKHSPFYIADRVGKDENLFKMYKLRSMRIGADKNGVSSTGALDPRITPIGHFVRTYKLDELVQLINVIKGDLSLVGPRPNVPSGVAVYTDIERRLLLAKPGITDMASIVFSDEGEILKNSRDPDADYDRLIRPWKSELGLLYLDKKCLTLDIKIIFLTAVAILSRPLALRGIQRTLARLGAREELIRVARRSTPLRPSFPPGVRGPVASHMGATH